MNSKRLLSIFAIAFMALHTVDLNAQKYGIRDRFYFITAQGGLAFSMNENFNAFIKEKKAGELFCPQGSVSFGRYLDNRRYGFRLSLEYSRNRSAWNYQEAFQFKPYSFQSVDAFVDAMVNCGDVSRYKAFNCRVFLGFGYAYSFGFELPQDAAWWYSVSGRNLSFGIRAGVILEYVTPPAVSVYSWNPVSRCLPTSTTEWIPGLRTRILVSPSTTSRTFRSV